MPAMLAMVGMAAGAASAGTMEGGDMLANILAVAGGGALGAVCRYLLGIGIGRIGGDAPLWGAFPLSTFLANFIGCFAIGVLSMAFEGALSGRDAARLFAITGIMGGFTTFSTFSLETVALLHDGAWGMAALNVCLSLGACLAGVLAGRMLFQLICSR